ncbi:MAG: flagellar assembly protein FliW [Proteobacteria bacterium]|nr:flagellar assembly protein FliW [Pseudomonadota bacterium]
MELKTRQFGVVPIDETKIITMPKGLPGFPELKKFIILDHEDIRPFHSLQSVDDSKLAFIIMDPFLFKADYTVDIEPYIKEMEWGKDASDSLFLYVIINATNPDPRHLTANLLGPLLINIKKNQGVQMMVSDKNYSSKYLIFGGMKKEVKASTGGLKKSE